MNKQYVKGVQSEKRVYYSLTVLSEALRIHWLYLLLIDNSPRKGVLDMTLSYGDGHLGIVECPIIAITLSSTLIRTGNTY